MLLKIQIETTQILSVVLTESQKGRAWAHGYSDSQSIVMGGVPSGTASAAGVYSAAHSHWVVAGSRENRRWGYRSPHPAQGPISISRPHHLQNVTSSWEHVLKHTNPRFTSGSMSKTSNMQQRKEHGLPQLQPLVRECMPDPVVHESLER